MAIMGKLLDALGGNPEYFGDEDIEDVKDTEDTQDINLTFDSGDTKSDDKEPDVPDSSDDPKDAQDIKDTQAPKQDTKAPEPKTDHAQDSKKSDDVPAPADTLPQLDLDGIFAQPEPDNTPAQPEPEGDSTPTPKTEYDDDMLTTDVHTVSDTINPILPKKEDANKMQNLEYYSKIAAKIHDFHATGQADTDVKALFIDGIKTDKELAKELLRSCLPELLEDPVFVEIVKDEIRQAADRRPDPVKRLFVNVVDPRDNNEYETWEEACASVRDNPYVTNPKDVFKTIYRLVDADGNLGNKVSPEEIEKYAATFDGNREAFLARMGLKRKPANQGQNQQKGSDPNKGKKQPPKNNAS